MLHHRSRVAGLLALAAVLVLAPAAAAAPSSKASAAKAKERAYGKYCGPKKKAAKRTKQRAKCLNAMASLATGKSSSPSRACRALSRKKVKGERKSAYARCVSEGAKLLKAKRRGGSTGNAGGDGQGADAVGEGETADSDPVIDGGEAVDDFNSIPPEELLPEDFLSADQLDPDF